MKEQRIQLCTLAEIPEKTPTHKLVKDLDLVLIKYSNNISVLYGRCLHRGALLADGYIEGDNLICGVHGWDYRFDTGISEYKNDDALYKFDAKIESGVVYIDENEVDDYLTSHPQPFKRDEYLGQYADTHPETRETHTQTESHTHTH